MALPYVTEGQIKKYASKIAELEAKIVELEAKIKTLEAKETGAQKIVIGENTDGTVSMSIKDE